VTRRVNWQPPLGFLVSVAAFVSYPLLFVRWALTRDFPWGNLFLFGIAAALVGAGLRRAWGVTRTESASAPAKARLRLGPKIMSAVCAGLSALLLVFFIFTVFVSSRWLPASRGAPAVGQKAPDFNLVNTEGHRVSLGQLLSSPINGKAPRGLLLVFYRGYW
jgi:hypothetical protein